MVLPLILTPCPSGNQQMLFYPCAYSSHLERDQGYSYPQSVQEKCGIVNKFSEKMDSPHDIFSYNIKQMVSVGIYELLYAGMPKQNISEFC